jgi:hypothetical protein
VSKSSVLYKLKTEPLVETFSELKVKVMHMGRETESIKYEESILYNVLKILKVLAILIVENVYLTSYGLLVT